MFLFLGQDMARRDPHQSWSANLTTSNGNIEEDHRVVDVPGIEITDLTDLQITGLFIDIDAMMIDYAT